MLAKHSNTFHPFHVGQALAKHLVLTKDESTCSGPCIGRSYRPRAYLHPRSLLASRTWDGHTVHEPISREGVPLVCQALARHNLPERACLLGRHTVNEPISTHGGRILTGPHMGRSYRERAYLYTRARFTGAHLGRSYRPRAYLHTRSLLASRTWDGHTVHEPISREGVPLVCQALARHNLPERACLLGRHTVNEPISTHGGRILTGPHMGRSYRERAYLQTESSRGRHGTVIPPTSLSPPTSLLASRIWDGHTVHEPISREGVPLVCQAQLT
ncbi:hypothetical protein GGS21DRAFT_493341 [Xylaria nigripes]|nr:hypothetical protein GGS21DRAFT_493341 [Xylaria nigripes]